MLGKKNGDLMDGVLAVGARGFAGVVSPQTPPSRCPFAAHCENIDATVQRAAGGRHSRTCTLLLSHWEHVPITA